MNDMYPEEQDPQFEELITLLQKVDLNPPLINPTEHAQIISQARARLFPTDPEVSRYEEMPTSMMRGLSSFQSKPKAGANKPHRGRRLIRLAYMLAAVLVVVVLIGSSLLFFGPWSPLQRDRSGAVPPTGTISGFTLQVTPSTIALGGIITLHGTNFSSSTQVGLTLDSNITLIDTNGASIIRADANGSFSDTALVDPSWGAGPHVIHAEDAMKHKSASFTITVTGKGTSLRPAHLLFSMNAIDLGSGDQATNNTQKITLSNVGGGQITWQATATQSWLQISPKSGTFSYGQSMQVIVACDRSNLQVGSYSASLIFISNTGQATLPVKMRVTPLQPGMVSGKVNKQ